MDAIELLEEQHREVEDLFEAMTDAEPSEKRALFADLADQLTVHATIEERHFYPAIVDPSTNELLRESRQEHLTVKRLLAEILDHRATDGEFDAKIKLLEREVAEHVEEEETMLFPRVRDILDENALAVIAEQMIATQDSLFEDGQPRHRVEDELAPSPHQS
jgi:hemerythrin superfamily protein